MRSLREKEANAGRPPPGWTGAPADAISSAQRRTADPRRGWEGVVGLKTFFLKTFTWWNGSTFGMDLFTRRMGEKVGVDEQGNVYYRSRGGAKDKALGSERRWVIYNGEAEASSVPPGWSGWLSFTHDAAPSQEEYSPREWQKAHQANMTGTSAAYRPKGSALGGDARQPSGGDYQPWKPNS